MAHKKQTASDEVAANQQATTTSFDVIQSQDILKQLTGNTRGIYRKQSKPAYVKWLQRVFGWIGRHR